MADDLNNNHEKDELLKIFEQGERSYFKRLADMFKGFGQPKDSLEFKQAMIEFQRLGAPIAAFVIVLTAVAVMSLVKFVPDEKPPAIETQIIEPEPAEELAPEEPPPPEQPPELDEVVETDVVVDIDAPPTTSAEQSPQPAPMDAVALTPSPVVLKGVHGSRDPGLRGAKIGRYGAASTEKLVYGFLRWLKLKQGQNGLWNDNVGDTSLALLCYLAHGELPGQSEEFGPTVEKAIRALIDDQIKTEDEAKKDRSDKPRTGGVHEWRRGEVGYFRHRDQSNYAQLVAVYALAEAYAMTRIPDLKPVVERAIKPIIDGQNASGGWYYNLDPKCPITDTSYASWAVQALKAAKLAHVGDQKLKGQIVASLKKASNGIKTCLHTEGPNLGAFGYLDKKNKPREFNSYYGLTAPCVLILQMLDEGDTELCRKSLEYMKGWDPTFKRVDNVPNDRNVNGKRPIVGKSPQYYCYYLSQVRFNQGERHPDWLRWNEKQKALYSAAAINIPAEKSGYVDHNGTPQYITFWPINDGQPQQFKGESKGIMDKDRLMQDKNTKNGKRRGIPVEDLIIKDATSCEWQKGKIVGNCLTALQLMVYYRNSPLAKGALSKIEAEVEVKVEDKNEVTFEGLDL